MSISEFTPVVEALERAERLRVERPMSSIILSTPDTPRELDTETPRSSSS
jgi:hypothetical protein